MGFMGKGEWLWGEKAQNTNLKVSPPLIQIYAPPWLFPLFLKVVLIKNYVMVHQSTWKPYILNPRGLFPA